MSNATVTKTVEARFISAGNSIRHAGVSFAENVDFYRKRDLTKKKLAHLVYNDAEQVTVQWIDGVAHNRSEVNAFRRRWGNRGIRLFAEEFAATRLEEVAFIVTSEKAATVAVDAFKAQGFQVQPHLFETTVTIIVKL